MPIPHMPQFKLPPIARPTFPRQSSVDPATGQPVNDDLSAGVSVPPPPPMLRPIPQAPVLPPPMTAQPMPEAPPVPPREPTALEQFDQLTPPAPRTGAARYAGAFVKGGLPGVLVAALDRKAPEREQYEMDRQRLMDRAGIKHQMDADELNRVQKEAYAENIQSQKDSRAQSAEDRKLGREMTIAQNWEEVQPGTIESDPQRYEYATIDGKQRRRLSEAGKRMAAQEVKTAEWPTVTPEMEKEYGKFGFKAGQKVDPARITQLVGFEEANGRAKEANELKKTLAEQATQTRIALGQMAASSRASSGSGGGGSTSGGDTDAKAIAQAIIDGKQPPDLKGMYRHAVPVRAELARKGYDLTVAQRDWTAVQKHMSTLNGPQQERLRQAITFTYDSVDVINSLYDEWKSVGKPSGFSALNKASLAAAKQLPGRAGEVARALEAQINDLTSELGTVYKGGNSSTDESLKLAASNLSADWNEKQFSRALDLIRKNLQIRKNSIDTSAPAGVTPGSVYVPPSQQPAPAGNVAPPAATSRPRATNPKTGETIEWDGSKWVKANAK